MSYLRSLKYTSDKYLMSIKTTTSDQRRQVDIAKSTLLRLEARLLRDHYTSQP